MGGEARSMKDSSTGLVSWEGWEGKEWIEEVEYIVLAKKEKKLEMITA
jgi:hypothetical protein